jgi:putative transposase
MPGHRVNRTLRSEQVLEVRGEHFVQRGVPACMRSDDAPEVTCIAVRDWLSCVRVQPLFIELGSPWENGHSESFHGKLRDELLNGESSPPCRRRGC